MAISNKMSILGTKKAVMAYNGGYYLPSVSDEGILSWSPTVEGMAPIPEVNVRGPQGSDASVTAEAVQAVVPIAWGTGFVRFGVETQEGVEGTAIGAKAEAHGTGNVAIGRLASTATNYNVAIGRQSRASGVGNVAIGNGATVKNSKNPLLQRSIAIGMGALTDQTTTITLGAQFTETTDSGNVTHTCTTEGTGSITIGAGANTLNNGDTESSNSVTIGCKASNSGADSVVIGAQAKTTTYGSIAVGGGAFALNTAVAVGKNSNAYADAVAIGAGSFASYKGVSIGRSATSIENTGNIVIGNSAKITNTTAADGTVTKSDNSTVIGYGASASAPNAVVLGAGGTVSDYGVTAIRSTADDGTYTQLYFSGANTPLANTYANGEGIMGYVTTDSEGNMVASGFKRLSALFDEGTMTQPAILNEDGEWEQPKVFHPSDLDMPIEESTEPEEYTPLPVYPIVESEIEEI